MMPGMVAAPISARPGWQLERSYLGKAAEGKWASVSKRASSKNTTRRASTSFAEFAEFAESVTQPLGFWSFESRVDVPWVSATGYKADQLRRSP